MAEKSDIHNLQKRVDFWSDRYQKQYQGNSPVFNFHDHLNIFKDKHILEIGPGEGRQFDHVYPMSSSYAIADISKEVLNQTKYINIQKYHITSYNDSFNNTFEVIHFWYVITHILKEELRPFFEFLYKLTSEKGVLVFNYQCIDEYSIDQLANDGMKTSVLLEEDIEKAMYGFFNISSILVKEKYYKTVSCSRC